MSNQSIAIGPLSGGEYGGVTQHVINIMKHVPRRFRPFGVPTFSTYSPMFQRILKPSAKKFRESPFFDPLGFVEIRILIHRNGIIHLHGSPWWPQAYDRPRGHRSKFVHTMHNYYFKGDFPAEDEVLFEQINKRALKSYGTADCVVVVAAWMKRFLADKIGIEAVHIPNGVDLTELASTSPLRFRAKYEIEEDFVLFAGRLDRYKRPNLFVKLAVRIPEKRFVMVGRSLTKREVEKYYGGDLPRNLMCLGQVPRSDLLDAMSGCRVFVNTASNEAAGIAIMEAMGLGRPVVAANAFGPTEFVENEVNGFLFNPDNMNSLEKALMIAWDSEDAGREAARLIRKSYDWRVLSRHLDETYKAILG